MQIFRLSVQYSLIENCEGVRPPPHPMVLSLRARLTTIYRTTDMVDYFFDNTPQIPRYPRLLEGWSRDCPDGKALPDISRLTAPLDGGVAGRNNGTPSRGVGAERINILFELTDACHVDDRKNPCPVQQIKISHFQDFMLGDLMM